MKQLFYDLETTGLDPETNAIHQISGLVVIDGEVRESFNLHVRPYVGAVVSQEALDISGVTVEQIMEGMPEETACGELLSTLERYAEPSLKSDRFFLCGYNSLRFDNLFLEEFFKRNGKRTNRYFWHGGIDVMVLASDYLAPYRHNMPNFKQGTVAATLGVKFDPGNLHDAMYDVQVCYEIYKRVKRTM